MGAQRHHVVVDSSMLHGQDSEEIFYKAFPNFFFSQNNAAQKEVTTRKKSILFDVSGVYSQEISSKNRKKEKKMLCRSFS